MDNDNGVPFTGEDDDGVKYEAKADIVQHVVFKEFYEILDKNEAMIQLKDAVLEEFPAHVQNYFKMHNLQPNTPRGGLRPLEELNSIQPVARNIHDLYEGGLR